MNAKHFFPLLLVSLTTTLIARGQMSPQGIKTCQMLGMQPYTVSVSYSWHHRGFDHSHFSNGKPINAVWTGNANFTADIYLMPGDPAKYLGDLSPENMVRWSVGGSSTIKPDSGCSASYTINGLDGPRLNFQYLNDKSWAASAGVQPKDPPKGLCIVEPFGSFTFGPANAKLTRNSANSFSVSGNYSKDTTVEGIREIYYGDFVMTVAPTGPPQQWEARIVPLDKPGYQKWLPLGPPLDGSYKKGNTVGFTISIRQKKDTNVLYQFSYDVDWSLHDVTTNEGYCGNYPAKHDNPDTKPDLRFDDSVYKLNKALSSFAEDRLVSKKEEGMGVPAIVTCFDYGAYGVLQAKVTLHDGTSLDAFSYRNPDKASVTIPCDDNGNRVADQYERQQKIYDKSYSADWDGEKLMPGTRSTGDGLTLFEEYRGFALEDKDGNRLHRRLSPDTADAFYHTISVEDPANVDLFKQGAKLFVQTTGINLIYIKNEILLGAEEDGDWPNRKLNFNKCVADKYKVDAVIIKSNNHNDWTWTPPISGDIARSYCPSETNYIEIYMKSDFANHSSGLPPNVRVDSTSYSLQFADTLLAKNVGIDVHFATIANYITKNVDQLNQNLVIFEVMHELGHSMGMRHHEIDKFLTDEKANNLAHESAIEIANFLKRVKKNANDPDGLGKSIDGIIAKVYQVANYSATSSWDYFTRGDSQCPMDYWFCPYHSVEYLTFLSGNWDPSKYAPILKQWQFCDINRKEFHLHP